MAHINSENLLTISSWNINGLECKINGIKSNKLYDQEVIDSLNKSDFIGLVETHADPNTDISLKGYYVFRKDRPKHKKAWKASGGIAVLVKESLRNACKFDPVSDSDVVWVRVQKDITKLSSDLYLAFVYLPPCNSTYGKANGKEIIQKLEKHIDFFSCKGKVIICGDFNARVGDGIDCIEKEEEPHLPIPNDGNYEFILPRISRDNITTNQYGKWLIDLCSDNQMYIVNGRTLGDFTGKFTCHTPRGSSVIDYFISSRSLSNTIFNMYVHDVSLFSDHCALTMKLKICRDNLIEDDMLFNETDKNCVPLPDKFVWSEEAKQRYQETFHTQEIKSKISDIEKEAELQNVHVQSLIDKLTDVMLFAGNKALLRRSFKSKRKQICKVNKKWYDNDCRSVLRQVKSAKNAFNRNVFNSALRMQYYSKFKDYKRLVKYKKRKYKEGLTIMLSNAMENDPQTAWKVINELKNDSLPAEKAEKINRTQWFTHFRDLLLSNTNQIDSDRQNNVKEELGQYEKSPQNGNLDYEITEKEIMDACRKLKNNKASAYDMIKNEMIKSALPFIKHTVVKVFNTLLKEGQFPVSWTEGIIIPVYKQGGYTDPNNYRGITLNSCLGKLFCHVLNTRISNNLENRSFLIKEQAGFRKNFRTSDQLFILKTIVDKYIQKNGKMNKLYACFIDLKKAFDTVWHEGLLLKLQRAGINGKIYELLKSMYHGSISRVKCKRVLTEPISIKRGVHQGSVLSPLLFNIFINDIGDDLLLDDAPILHDSNISHLLYADDLVLLSTTEIGLQSNIDRVNTFCKRWGLAINKDKSKIMVFSKTGRVPRDKFRYNLGGEEIEYVNHYKYLGVNFSNTAKFSVAEKHLSLKANRALFSVKQSIFDKGLKPSAIINIFETLVKPIALYGSEIWTAYKPCYKSKTVDEMFEMSFKSNTEFDKIHAKFCKYVLGVHSKACNFAVFSELGQFPSLVTTITGCINFWMHILQSGSETLISKAYIEQYNSSNDKCPWVQFVKNILQDLGFSHVWYNHSTFNSCSLLASIKNKLKERFVSFWKKRMLGDETKKKLRTYRLLKQDFGMESYLEDIHDKSVRKCLSSFRISAHRLRIERGRYVGEKPEDRLCITCNTIEDEIHFLCQCQNYENQRKILYDNLKDTRTSPSIDPAKTFLDLMTNCDKHVINAVGKYIQECNII